ncbi:hypothetical protein LSAT2_029837 [Lamellibrachia satsuma]|nr:hypothetical protein LSAT2_029837 [Lamellibrachia satsuma]
MSLTTVYCEQALMNASLPTETTAVVTRGALTGMECCKRYKVSPECLGICHPKHDRRLFVGAMLCHFKYIHIVHGCDTGSSPNFDRADLCKFEKKSSKQLRKDGSRDNNYGCSYYDDRLLPSNTTTNTASVANMPKTFLLTTRSAGLVLLAMLLKLLDTCI